MLLARLVVGGDVVNVRRVGRYTITYDVTDLTGYAADRITRVVEVRSCTVLPRNLVCLLVPLM